MSHNESAHLLLFMVRARPLPDANLYLNKLSANFPNSKIHLAGNSKLIGQLDLAENINWFQSIHDFERTIKNLAHVN